MDMASLFVDGDDDDGIVYGQGELEDKVDYSLCLVGRFVTDRPINYNDMSYSLAELWRPGEGVHVHELNGGLYLFHFFHEVDLYRVMILGPWTFDNHALILEPMAICPLLRCHWTMFMFGSGLWFAI